MPIIKFLGEFLVVIALSLVGGYVIWTLKGKKTEFSKEADKAFNFISYKAGFYLLLLIVAIIVIAIIVSNF